VTGPGRRDDDDEDDEARAFAEAIKGAKPLDPAQRQRRATGGPEHATARPRASGRAATAGPSSDAPAVPTSGETVSFRADGVDARQLARLRDGDYPVEATLDLHGRARAEAADALDRFVAAAEAAGRRCLLVVHGRGHRSEAEEPVLRPAVWQWLAAAPRARAAVMAFVSAPARLGGAGATLVLIRRKR
jgi:DNA-nicking Smr family endonuclease